MKEQDSTKIEIFTPKAFDTFVFDMDGTLYTLDGDNSGYQNSSLEKIVLSNIVELIMTRESLSREDAITYLNEVRQKTHGFSTYFSELYDITREDFFNIVWDINPEGIVKNFELAVEVIKHISQNYQNLVLLTQAPSIWQQKVIDYLGLNGCFSEVYTGESYQNKGEIFEILASKYEPEKMISIGDQLKTDIEPAESFGIKGFLVRSPKDVSELLKII